ncbi:thermostable hemolysin [Pseudoduganella chitinolytica]|uniref:Thermostable hemolysin n=1 Tax=Pseudoduganella chitinolytica TaxID=34070 RepID=A0ABY8BGA2_9BURK|nr:thermostable hemolysin [Pseudoduganella chitinolytica]WEF33324.1 thermostable hemolysin [Pseudoduganella chitinolytica]
MHTAVLDNVVNIQSASAPGVATGPSPAGGLAFQLELGNRSLVFKLVGPDERYYGAAVELARAVYLRAYGATIAPRPHRFIVCVDLATGAAIACAGLSFAGRAPLFSEHYLDAPLEQMLAGVFQRDVARRDVAEVTALATIEPTIGTELMRALPLICWYLGLRGVICTVTSKLRRCFDSMKLAFHPIAQADAARLPRVPGVDWGTYYDTRPMTGVIRVDALGEFFDTVSCRYNRHLLAGEAAEGAQAVAATASMAVAA